MWPSTNFGMPALPLAITGRLGCAAWKPRTVRSRSEAPTPQLAPKASGGFGSSATSAARSAAVTPIIVRPAVSKLMVQHQGAPVRAMPRAAARSSSGAEMVSTQSTSAPPASRPLACSSNMSAAASTVSGPSGAMISPVGPIEPATTTGRPAASAACRAMAAARRLSSKTRSSASCSFSRLALPPKLLVRNRSLPAPMAPS